MDSMVTAEHDGASECSNCCTLDEYAACCTPELVSVTILVIKRDIAARGPLSMPSLTFEQIFARSQLSTLSSDASDNLNHRFNHTSPLII